MRARRFLLHGLLALLVATGASGMGAYAQTPPADGVRMPVTLPDSAVWRIRSEGSGLEYPIMVAWPDYPPPENGYRVIYVLDANAVFLTTEIGRATVSTPVTNAPLVCRLPSKQHKKA